MNTTIAGFEPFVGEHCETTATGNLLHAAGLPLSEPMMFGLGQGLSYGIFTFKGAPAPFIGGRTRPEQLTQDLASRLGLDVDVRTTRSARRAWANVADFVDRGVPVGVKLNMRLLDYDTTGADFAGHFVAAYGYDGERVYVVDTRGQGGARVTSRASFEAARLWKGPMSSNALTWTIAAPHPIAVRSALPGAIAATAQAFLNPPIANFGVRGIRKTARVIRAWPQEYAAADLAGIGHLMEHGGTGGGLFRRMYAAFLREAAGVLGDSSLLDVAEQFEVAAGLWSQVAAALEQVAGPGSLGRAAGLLHEIADVEEAAMQALAD